MLWIFVNEEINCKYDAIEGEIMRIPTINFSIEPTLGRRQLTERPKSDLSRALCHYQLEVRLSGDGGGCSPCMRLKQAFSASRQPPTWNKPRK